MSTLDLSSETTRRLHGRRVHLGDLLLQGIAGLAALAALVVIGLIVWKVIDGARESLSRFGLGFVTTVAWDPVHNLFGAGSFLYGTALTSLIALLLAGPLAMGIALFLTELAPRWIQAPVTALVETLAAIPSVVVGLWGILVLAPTLRDHVEPFLHRTFGFIPLFGNPQTGHDIFTAVIVLTIMILPIVSSISRELFLGVPSELKEAALGLGTTRWEMVRGVMFPYARGGIAAALILGLGRAVGEAIAVTQVIGGFVGTPVNLFSAGDTLASKIASEYQGAATNLETSALIHLALILLVFSLLVNVFAQVIVRSVARRQGLTGVRR
ncbi:MAG TPA: phosphate ABC transporter permease subunit PstC [Gaiellaceae bacterium]|nr:phosphate ABC transporter permease subunit PstC [Gaiellaceae bacterium]